MIWETYWTVILASIILVPSICVAIFAYWIKTYSSATGEIAAKYWDVFVKLISAFTVIFSGAMLFGKYIDQQQSIEAAKQGQVLREIALQEAEYLKQKLAFDTRKHDKRNVLLSQAKQVASRLASQQPPDPALELRFEELYYADLIGIEQKGGPVERAMIGFRKELKGTADEEQLKQLSLNLSRAVTTELKSSEDALLAQHKQITALVTRSSKTSN